MILHIDFNEVDAQLPVNFNQTECTFNINFNEVDSQLAVKFIQTECSFYIDFGEIFYLQNDNDIYDGAYTITPRVYGQMLPTKDKLMIDDVKVKVIPLSKVMNLSNGYTVTIG